MPPKTVVFITGLSASGKSSTARELSRETGFGLFSIGQFQRDWVANQGYKSVVDFNRRMGPKKSYFVILPDLMKKIMELVATHDGLVVEGLYTRSIYDGVRKAFPEAHVHVFNLGETRHKRVARYAEREKVVPRRAKIDLSRFDLQKMRIGLGEVQRMQGPGIHRIRARGGVGNVVTQIRRILSR